MCGIAGAYDSLKQNRISLELGRSMRTAVAHRGPDGVGEEFSPNHYLGHTRLSILDLSESGNQPLLHPKEEISVVFNGEIYNYQSLRTSLKTDGANFKTQTDGEVIPFLIEKSGKDFVSHLNGMFAIAAFHKSRSQFYLVRDRMGIKPLYYAWKDGILYFGSEIKSLLQVAELARDVDFQSIYDYLSLGYVPEPATGFRGIWALEPGSMLICENGELKKIRYHENRVNSSEELSSSTQEEFEHLFGEAVSSHLMSDVPLGAFLSGGIDSSSVVVAAARASKNLPSFCAKFSDKQYDESPYAKMVADAAGTKHFELNLAAGTADPDLLWKIISHYDQPFGDSSLVPTYLISSEIRKHVKVALSGDGGDEILTGYTIFNDFPRIYDLMRIPVSLRRFLLKLTQNKVIHGNFGRRLHKAMRWSFSKYPQIAAELQSWIPEQEKVAFIQGDFARFCDKQLLPIDRLYESFWQDSDFLKSPSRLRSELTSWMLKYSLPGDMLKKVDMMSMLAGIEVRVPLLADDLVKFSLAQSMSFKTDGRIGKLPLRRFLKNRVPHQILTKRKWGFAVPLDSYASGGFLELIRSKLLGPQSHCRSYFDSKEIASFVNQFEGRNVDRLKISRQGIYQRIFMLLSLEAFFERAGRSSSAGINHFGVGAPYEKRLAHQS